MAREGLQPARVAPSRLRILTHINRFFTKDMVDPGECEIHSCSYLEAAIISSLGKARCWLRREYRVIGIEVGYIEQKHCRLTPEALQIFPSTTQRAGLTHSVLGPYDVMVAQDCLFVVAFLPSSTPALAASPAPVHTVNRYFSFG